MSRVVGIVGAGSFGLALSKLLCENSHEVTVWTRSKERALRLCDDREDPERLPGVKIPEQVLFTNDLERTLKNADMAVLVIPSVHTRETAGLMREYLKSDAIIVNCSKGIEESGLKLLTQVIKEELPGTKVTVLSGPSHAEEVGRAMPTAIVAASEDADTAREVQEAFMSSYFRVYTGTDVKGVELGGALKNVIALASGVADGLGYGDNTRAAMITRGITEITRLGVTMGAQAETFSGLTGIGDLIVTCSSMHSRNRRAGILIGQGMSASEACAEIKMVVEGINSAKAAGLLADKYSVSMPIITEVNRVLFEDKKPADAVADLMLRDKKSE